MTKRELQWLRRIREKRMDFLHPKNINKFSETEKEMLFLVKEKCKKRKIDISLPDLKKSWRKIKTLFIDRLHQGNVDFSIFLMNFFWSPIGEKFSRIHIKEIAKLEEYLNWLRNFGKHEEGSEQKLRDKSLLGWLEFKHMIEKKRKKKMNEI